MKTYYDGDGRCLLEDSMNWWVEVFESLKEMGLVDGSSPVCLFCRWFLSWLLVSDRQHERLTFLRSSGLLKFLLTEHANYVPSVAPGMKD